MNSCKWPGKSPVCADYPAARDAHFMGSTEVFWSLRRTLGVLEEEVSDVVPAPGLEPGQTAPKAAGLPITPRRNVATFCGPQVGSCGRLDNAQDTGSPWASLSM